MNELEFDTNNWMARAYRRFVVLGGRERNPENLCRFLRVVFLWSPLRRFFKGTAPLDCTPFGFSALVAVAALVATAFIFQIYRFLFHNWIAGLVFAWVVWFLASFINTLHWYLDRGGNTRIQDWYFDTLVRPVQAIQTYRKARGSRFCPLIKFVERDD